MKLLCGLVRHIFIHLLLCFTVLFEDFVRVWVCVCMCVLMFQVVLYVFKCVSMTMYQMKNFTFLVLRKKVLFSVLKILFHFQLFGK